MQPTFGLHCSYTPGTLQVHSNSICSSLIYLTLTFVALTIGLHVTGHYTDCIKINGFMVGFCVTLWLITGRHPAELRAVPEKKL